MRIETMIKNGRTLFDYRGRIVQLNDNIKVTSTKLELFELYNKKSVKKFIKAAVKFYSVKNWDKPDQFLEILVASSLGWYNQFGGKIIIIIQVTLL